MPRRRFLRLAASSPAAVTIARLPAQNEAAPIPFLDEGDLAVGAPQGAGAFLATGMNGSPLPEDHGRPLRLIVPGWYGCCCIKWVQRLRWMGSAEPATEQMLEYARRTHQNGRPARAADFRPAEIDAAAMPIRVERLPGRGRARHRVVGIVWGGRRPPAGLVIRFDPGEGYVPVTRFTRGDVRSWNLWGHEWSPVRSGRYTIELQVSGPGLRTRRLDRGYYRRSVEVGLQGASLDGQSAGSSGLRETRVPKRIRLTSIW